MIDKVIWPERYHPSVSSIYALNDAEGKASPEVVWKLLVNAKRWARYFPAEDQPAIRCC
jgi:hypothetical protein